MCFWDLVLSPKLDVEKCSFLDLGVCCIELDLADLAGDQVSSVNLSTI
jgi:hypothetical protein